MEVLVRNRRFVVFLLIPIVSLFMHLHVFKLDLIGYHVWRQTQTQTTIDNYYKEDFNILNPKVNNRGNGDGIVRMEFPVMQWGFAGFYKVFGDYVIISRILTFIIGIFSIWGIYLLLLSLFKRPALAIIGAWCFNFSPVFYYYMLNPLPDNLALCCSIYGMAFFFKWLNESKYLYVILSATFISLASLAKLPFIVCMSGIGMYLLLEIREKRGREALKIGLIYLCFLSAPIAWYLSVIGTWTGNGVVSGILSVSKSDMLNLLDILQGNLFSTLPELLINYGSLLFFFVGLWVLFKHKKYRNKVFPVLLCWGICTIIYFLYEMNLIGTIHDYYMLPFLPPIFIIVAYGAEKLITNSNKALRIITVIAFCILPVTAFLRADHRWNTVDPGFNKNLLVYKNELRNAVPDNKLCVVGNDESTFIFFYYINKKGWSFNDDQLNGDSLKRMINRGAAYLYTDSKKVENDSSVQNCIRKLILQKGDVNVYELKNACDIR